MIVSATLPEGTTADLVTLTEAKEHLRLPAEPGPEDVLISGYITAATAAIEQHCKKYFVPRDVVEELDGTGGRAIFLAKSPVLSLTSVSVDEAVLAATEYKKASGIGMIRKTSGEWEDGMQNIEVQYQAGYNPIPNDVKQACLILVAHFYEHRTDGEKSTSLGGETKTLDEIPWGVRQLLQPYRTMGV